MFLDTAFCVDLLREFAREKPGRATQKLAVLTGVPLRISIFVLCELQAGVQQSKYPDRDQRFIHKMVSLSEIVYPTREFALVYGETFHHLAKRGLPIPVMDLLIGVMAKIYGEPLLTSDEDHFSRIPGLVVESY